MTSTAVASLSMRFAVSPSAEKAGKTEKDSSDCSSPPIDILYTKEDKDTLAYEHDRARHMKTLDRARTKARKAFSWGNASAQYTSKRDGPGSHGRGKNPVEEASVSLGKGGKDEGRELAGDYHPVGVKCTSPKRGEEFVWSAGTPFSEVRLADLVVLAAGSTGSQRRNRGPAGAKGGLDGDFEIVPHVRSVIVLEDGVGHGELDEGWECVQAEEDEKKGLGKTYARVAAAAMEDK